MDKCIYVFIFIITIFPKKRTANPAPACRLGCGRFSTARLPTRIQRRQDAPPAPQPLGVETGPSGAASYRPHGPATARHPRGRASKARKGRSRAEPPRPKHCTDWGEERRSPPAAPPARPAIPAAPPARGLPLPVPAAASELSPLPQRSPRPCPRRGGAESLQPRPCGGGERCPGRRALAAEPPAAAGTGRASAPRGGSGWPSLFRAALRRQGAD